jgi:carbon-monoxide dehydrogenase medium subunit
MPGGQIDWLTPATVAEALALRARHGAGATVLAGGTFLGILMNEEFIEPAALLSLGRVEGLDGIEVTPAGELRLGAMVTHRTVERSAAVRDGWPVLTQAFALVASPRVRNQATVGGVLADADYASDPPAVLEALDARVVLRSSRAEREVPVRDLILGHYETCIADDELLVEVRVPPGPDRAVYRKFRSRSSEDRPCVAVAAARTGRSLRVVVGAVAARPRELADACALGPGAASEIGRRYADGIEPIGDSRGSAAYRRRVIAAEVTRAVEAVA